MKFHQIFSAIAMLSMLAACGGGDVAASDPSVSGGVAAPADVADKYVGTWTFCGQQSPSTSYLATLVGTKLAADSINYNYSETEYVTADCTGQGSISYTESGRVAYQGTKTIGTTVVDKGEGTVTADSDQNTTEPRVEKDISLLSGTTLYFGDSSSLDTEGYPNAILRQAAFTKR